MSLSTGALVVVSTGFSPVKTVLAFWLGITLLSFTAFSLYDYLAGRWRRRRGA